MGGGDPLTAGFFILSWLMLMLGLTQLVATVALRATVGASKDSTSSPRSEAGASFSDHYRGGPFLCSFLEGSSAVQVALNTVPSKGP